MRKYISTTLIQGEQVVLTPTIHNIVYAKPFVFFGIISCFLIMALCIDMGFSAWVTTEAFVLLISLIWFLFDQLYYAHVEMAVTNKRVVAKTGIISVHSDELQWNKIESIEIRQGIVGRCLNYGDVYFSGTGTSYVRFGDVRNPWVVKSKAAEILSE